MRRLHAPSVLGLALAAMLLHSAPPGWPEPAGAQEPPAESGARVVPRLVGAGPHRAGRPLELEVAVMNGSDRPLDLGDSTNDRARFGWEVTYRAVAGAPREVCARQRYYERVVGGRLPEKANHAVVVAPGRGRVYRFDLGRMFDLSVAGVYTVRATKGVRPHAAERALGELGLTVFDQVRSEELEFELIEP